MELCSSKKLSALLRRITDFYGILMPSEKKKILKFNQYVKSDKMPYIFYANTESLIRKIDGCANNPEKSSKMKIDEHISCGYSLLTIVGFDHIENKHTLYRGKDCMKKFCDFLENTPKIYLILIKKEMLPLTEEKLYSYHDAKICYICGTRILETFAEDIKYQKVTVHRHYTGKYRGATHSLCNLKFNVPNEISVNFQRGSNYDYHFIIKELAKELEEQFEFIGENKEKYRTFSVPVKTEIIKIDKDGNETVETISYKIKFIDSARFMASSLLLVI